MKKYFDRIGKKIYGTHQKVATYWRRLMNHSTRTKQSEGSEQIEKLMTSAHKDQWRRKDKR